MSDFGIHTRAYGCSYLGNTRRKVVRDYLCRRFGIGISGNGYQWTVRIVQLGYLLQPFLVPEFAIEHDSIEMLLKLIAEHHNIKSDNFNFLDYWTHIPSLTLKESMRNVNARRVNIKHKGLLPSKSDIEITRVNTTDFFEQNVITQLGIDFKSISLLTLISYENVRIHLEEAQQALDKNEIETCIEKSAIAFDDLLYTYEGNKSDYSRNSPFFFGESMATMPFSVQAARSRLS